MKVTVHVAREWSAQEAALKLADAAKAIHSTVKFCLLFSTIHYAKSHELTTLVRKVHENLDRPQMIGGTVAGFSTETGSYARGALLVAFSGDDFNVSSGHGLNTKRDPSLAVDSLYREISSNMQDTPEMQKILFEFTAGSTVPQLPFIKRIRVTKSELLNQIVIAAYGIFLRVFQKGVGREEEVLDALVGCFKDATIVGGSTIDRNELIQSFQFFNGFVLENAVVATLMQTKLVPTVNTTYGLKQTGINFDITRKTGNERILMGLDGQPATAQYFKKMRWRKEDLNERIYRRNFHFTLGFEDDGVLFPEVIGGIYGSGMYCGYKIKGNKLQSLVSDGKSLMDAVENNLSLINAKPISFAFFANCSSRLETLGDKLFKTREIISKKIDHAPFAIVYLGGEDSYSPTHTKRHTNYSLNSLVI